jgi:uroporphyrinogen-III synthase
MPRRVPLVVATREEQPDDGFARVLREASVRSIAMPTISIGPPEDPGPLTDSIARLASTQWIVFTSAQAVGATCGHAGWAGAWSALTARPRIAAVGPATAARVRAFGLPCDLVPERSNGRELAAALVARDGSLAGVHVLWPRSDVARRELPDALAAAGAIVSDPEAYRTVAIRPAGLATFVAKLDAGCVDAVAFFSPSAAAGLAGAFGQGTLLRLAGRTDVASIGPSTSAALVALGAPATIEADTRTGPGLATAILRQLAARAGAA